jgi:hypothetical protein
VGGIVTIAQAIRLACVAYSRIPYWDMWAVIHYLVRPDRPLAAWLWAQHNEHRIVTAKLLFAIDFRLFQGTEKFLLASGFVLLFAHLALLSWAMRAFGELRGAAWRTAAGLTAFCLFCPSQWENFTTGFQVCFFLLLFLVTVGCIAALSHSVSGGSGGRSLAFLLLAIAAGVAATFSLGNGLLIWPVLLLIAVLERYRRTAALAMVCTALLATATDLYHYHRMAGRSDPLRSLHEPWRVTEYVLKYLGAPWVESNFGWGMAFGCVAVAAALFALWWVVARSHREPVRVLLSALLLFYLATPVATALARQVVGTDQGAASARYEAFALMLWLALALLAIHFARRRRAALVLMQAVVIAVMLLAATRGKFPLRTALWRARVNNVAADAMLAGVLDPEAFAHVAYVPLDQLWSDALLLKAEGKSVFAGAQARQLATDVGSSGHLISGECWGTLQVEPVGPAAFRGLRVRGWAWDPLRERSFTELLFTSGSSIVGYGQGGFPRPAASAANMRFTGFTGYALAGKPGPLAAYGVLSSQGLCRIRPPRPGE